ncbi:Ankyrin repeat-containing protein ITN1 [Camellia lanceoleosa]|uniref:Ankyrin repeat-containing protein ITN1 n=1 Tax=Camellia lanceoleosa TaxID=1840588 RepID=A0ACC0F4W0_9ERIC|nr:Ankyrin repeat-containing protein ITN1 [Camellia lanceoleosa]
MEEFKHFLELHPDALSAQISSYGETALHIAALSGHVKIVEELVNMTSVEDLTLKNDYGETALSLAAGGGITRVAKPLVRKNHDLLGIKNINDVIPVVVAAQFGHTDMRNVEFVEEILTAYPDIVWILDKDERNIFLYAVLQRQEKIFTLLHKMGPKKNLIATSLDKDGNTILHHAAMLSPSSHLDGISGAALQMQRELQWFEEVEKVVQPMYREIQNNDGKTARALFTSEHKKLRREGEKWMKETSTSCTVVAALIATVMFTAVFTGPRGYNGTTGILVLASKFIHGFHSIRCFVLVHFF